MKAQPTILGLMGVIAFVAIGLAALRTNDELWAAVILAMTVSALCTASLVAIYHRGAWAGFAVFGWAHFFICQPYSAPAGGYPTLLVEVAYRLLCYVDPAANLVDSPNRPVADGLAQDGEGKLILFVPSIKTGVVTGGWVPAYSLLAGLCLASLVIGLLGAIVGSFVARLQPLLRPTPIP